MNGIAPTNGTAYGKPKGLSGLLRSKVFYAFIFFACISGLWAQSKFGTIAPSDFPFHTWTGWAVEDYLSDKQGRPNLVFLGSSLVLVPVAGVDADYLQRPIDGSHHHRSQYFEDRFRKKTGLSIKTFNFGLPGEMPSDAYLITKFLLKGEKRPDVIVYGVGPRDFMDNLLPSPSATDPYLYLNRFGDVSTHAHLIAPEWLQRLSFDLERWCFIYGHKYDFDVQTGRLLTAIMDRLVPKPATEHPFTIHDRRRLFPDYHPMEITANECFFRPTTKESRTFSDANLQEYKKRYAHLNWRTFLHQMTFLADLMNTARERGTQVVLVAMPITDLNRQLLEEGTWESYRRSLKVLATSKGATFIDLGDSPEFNLNDFMDTVHLHSGGGMKMLDIVAERAARERKVLAAFTRRSDAIAGIKGGQL
ncbi:MAG TPA: hypothetical protein V6D17_04235 [Candidatus Obscuribacterales bacterium]